MKTNQGFTLIEIIVAMLIVGLLMTALVPVLRSRPADERKAFIAEFNALVALGWYNALITHKVHRLYVQPQKHEITLQIQSSTDTKVLSFEPVKKAYLATRLSMPTQFEVQQFIVVGAPPAENPIDFYFVIMPDGLAQDVIINMYDKKDKLPNGEYRPFSLMLNPFSAQFTTYDAFQK